MNYWIYLTIKPCGNKNLFARLFIFAGIWLCASAATAADFGVAEWGMSLEQVKHLETRSNLTPFAETNYLIYMVSLNGIDQARIVYQFKQDRLVEGRFIFRTENPLDSQRAIEQYQQIKDMMTDQYGPPNTDFILTPDNSTPAPSEFANELASDRLILKSSWRSATATMQQQLAWHNNQPSHQLHYVPTNDMADMNPTLNTF